MAFLEIAKWAESGAFQTLIVDTAPTGHTLRLLAMPVLIRQWLEALEALLAKHRYMSRLFRATAPPDAADRFLQELALSVQGMERLLRDPARCRFVPVMVATELSLDETKALIQELDRAHIPVTDLVINRLFPRNPCPLCQAGRAQQEEVLERVRDNRRFSEFSLWEAPLYPGEVSGSQALAAFWARAGPLSPAPVGPPRTTRPAPPNVRDPGAPPAVARRLLLFAGKGGVGKTTLACATSLRLARDHPDQEFLLLSTDPAHSLTACLGTPVGPKPCRICPNLTGLELNAQDDFAALKNLYAEELDGFLKHLLPQMDLPFDREAMEKLLDLSPPGLDEVMALSQMMELLDHYHTVILDTAPTGHLIRLLEMPELIDQWLKAFFGVFLKYKQIFRLPKVTQRLIDLSKSLKGLVARLKDPKECALYAVSIPTGMAFEETRDLLAACHRMEVPCAALLLNLVTPPADCPLCAALHRSESAILTRFRQAFPDLPQTWVYRQNEPRGLPALADLGRVLYQAVPPPPVASTSRSLHYA